MNLPTSFNLGAFAFSLFMFQVAGWLIADLVLWKLPYTARILAGILLGVLAFLAVWTWAS